jgi:hypothetical protein
MRKPFEHTLTPEGRAVFEKLIVGLSLVTGVLAIALYVAAGRGFLAPAPTTAMAGHPVAAPERAQ